MLTLNRAGDVMIKSKCKKYIHIYDSTKKYYGQIQIKKEKGIRYCNFNAYNSVDSNNFVYRTIAEEITIKTIEKAKELKCEFAITKGKINSGNLTLMEILLENGIFFRSFEELKEIDAKELLNKYFGKYETKAICCQSKLSDSSLIIYIPLKQNAYCPIRYMTLDDKYYKNKGYKVLKITDEKPETEHYVITNIYKNGDEIKNNIFVDKFSVISEKRVGYE